MKSFDVIESLERRAYLSPLLFSGPATYAAGAHPSDVVTADLTGNGVYDLVTTNFASASIAVLRGNGNGTFQPPAQYAVGNSPEALVSGDFNADGKPDIVTANEADNTISVLLGNGDGTFASQIVYAVGLRPESIAVADLNGDGHSDIVVANDGSNSIDVLLGNGDGSFQPPVSYDGGTDPVGVAVGDFNGDERPDIVVINPMGSYLHVLLNHGDGTFAAPVAYATGQTPRAVAVADLNSDGRPDIVTTSLHDTTINFLQGNGDGTFQSDTSDATGFFPFSIAIADMNGDGRPDVVTSNEIDNTVGVLLHTETGTFVTNRGFNGGQAPVALAVADFNGDGRPDIVAADFNTNSVTVLTNQTVFPHLIPTAITLAPNQNPVEVGNRVVVTAQVVPSALSVRRPIGVVEFFSGDAVIGVARVSPSGVARIAPDKLTLGTHTITAHYAGDGVYAGVLSPSLVQSVVTPAQTSPLVQPGIAAVHLAAQYVPGDQGVADVAITDIGDGPAVGVVGLQLYASTSTTFDATAFPIAINRHQAAIRLAGGRSQIVPVTFTMPATIDVANYTIFAALTPVNGLNAAQISSAPAVGLNSSMPVLQFGRVPTHANYKLTRVLPNGSSVTFSIAGPGSGAITEDTTGAIAVSLSGTTGNSSFSLTGGAVSLTSVTDLSPVRRVNAPMAALVGSLSLSRSTGALTLASATSSTLFLGGGSLAATLSLGTVTSSSLYVAGAIHLLAVNSWSSTTADSITTSVINTITSAGDFGPAMIVNGGVGPRDLGITNATIAGTLGPAAWSIQSGVGTLRAGAIASGWSGSIHRTLYNLIDTGDFAGDLAAHQIGSVQISGSLNNAAILAGADFGPAAVLSPTGNTFGRGILASVVVNGSATNSVVAAGLSPVGGQLLGPGTTLLPASAIKSIAISGPVDSASKFLAVSLPATARIDGIVVTTANNSNFHL